MSMFVHQLLAAESFLLNGKKKKFCCYSSYTNNLFILQIKNNDSIPEIYFS